MKPRDLLSEALAGLLQRPTQAVVTIIGTAVGIGTLIATVGIARTAGNQIVTEVGAMAPTDIRVDVKDSSDPTIEVTVGWETATLVRRIKGVAQSGAMAELPGGPRVRTAPVASYQALAADVRVVAASPGLLRAVGATLLAGRDFDDGHIRRADAVALVGSAAAGRMRLRTGSSTEAIFLGDIPLLVMGIFDTSPVAPELSTAVLVSSGFAARHFGVNGPTRLYIAAEMGATEVVSRQVGLALFPRDPDAISVVHGSQPTRLTGRVASQVNLLFRFLGSLSLLVACFGIASTSLFTVMERTTEIGLRRALGIPARHIGVTFLLQAGISDAVGALAGTSAGLAVTVTVSAVRDWTPVLDPWLPPLAVVLGVLVGLLAGSSAAGKAMRIEPIAALTGARGTE